MYYVCVYVIVGPTEFLSEANGYPLRYDGLEEITQGAFRVIHYHIPHTKRQRIGAKPQL